MSIYNVSAKWIEERMLRLAQSRRTIDELGTMTRDQVSLTKLFSIAQQLSLQGDQPWQPNSLDIANSASLSDHLLHRIDV